MLIIQLIFNASQRLLPEGWNRRILSLFSDHFSNNKLNTLMIDYNYIYFSFIFFFKNKKKIKEYILYIRKTKKVQFIKNISLNGILMVS